MFRHDLLAIIDTHIEVNGKSMEKYINVSISFDINLYKFLMPENLSSVELNRTLYASLSLSVR